MHGIQRRDEPTRDVYVVQDMSGWVGGACLLPQAALLQHRLKNATQEEGQPGDACRMVLSLARWSAAWPS